MFDAFILEHFILGVEFKYVCLFGKKNFSSFSSFSSGLKPISLPGPPAPSRPFLIFPRRGLIFLPAHLGPTFLSQLLLPLTPTVDPAWHPRHLPLASPAPPTEPPHSTRACACVPPARLLGILQLHSSDTQPSSFRSLPFPSTTNVSIINSPLKPPLNATELHRRLASPLHSNRINSSPRAYKAHCLYPEVSFHSQSHLEQRRCRRHRWAPPLPVVFGDSQRSEELWPHDRDPTATIRSNQSPHQPTEPTLDVLQKAPVLYLYQCTI